MEGAGRNSWRRSVVSSVSGTISDLNLVPVFQEIIVTDCLSANQGNPAGIQSDVVLIGELRPGRAKSEGD